MTLDYLVEQIKTKSSYLCVGLDTNPEKIPKFLQAHPDAIFEFNKQIIDATKDLCVGYKINTAFYEAAGLKASKICWPFSCMSIETWQPCSLSFLGVIISMLLLEEEALILSKTNIK